MTENFASFFNEVRQNDVQIRSCFQDVVSALEKLIQQQAAFSNICLSQIRDEVSVSIGSVSHQATSNFTQHRAALEQVAQRMHVVEQKLNVCDKYFNGYYASFQEVKNNF